MVRGKHSSTNTLRIFYSRLNGIGGSSRNQDCAFWDDWSVSSMLSTTFRFNGMTDLLMLVLQRYDDRCIEASHACDDGRSAEFLFLDLEDRQFHRSGYFIQPALALPIRLGAGLGPARYISFLVIHQPFTICIKKLTDPREAVGHCAAVLGSAQPFDGTYAPTATGGVRAALIIFS